MTEEFQRDFYKSIGSVWISKPVASSQGRGIYILNDVSMIPDKGVISKYLSNPHLINGHKYDLRVYVLITWFDPLRVYVYDEGLTRFAIEEYSNEDYMNKFVHLTNYSVNKKSE